MHSLRPGSTVDLFLDGIQAGTVRIRGQHTAWGFGDFEPSRSFSRFAPIFGAWSLMMHADEESDRIRPEIAEELRAIEQAMDHLRARIHVEADQWIDLSEVNIDGPLIEWKQA